MYCFIVTVFMNSVSFGVPVRATCAEQARCMVSARMPDARIITVRRPGR
jgi:hypothetical protein